MSVNAHTAMAPFLAVRRAFEAADTDRDGLLQLDEAHGAVRGLGVDASREVLHISPRSPLHLPYISPTSPLHLP